MQRIINERRLSRLFRLLRLVLLNIRNRNRTIFHHYFQVVDQLQANNKPVTSQLQASYKPQLKASLPVKRGQSDPCLAPPASVFG